MMKIKNIILAFLLLTGIAASGQNFPKPFSPPRLVSDYTRLLSGSELSSLEQKLVDFNIQTSTQIAIVTLDDLDGYEISDYAVRLAEEWGIGQQDKENGILILVNPQDRKVFIATGYGLEGVVPDAIAKRIVQKEILPNFRNANYFAGLDAATNTLIGLTKGEFTADEYQQATGGSKAPYPIGAIILLIFVFSIFGRVRRARHYSAGRNIPFWVALSMMSSNRHHHGGGFGSFSSGSGSFGGGGGFGGFGGGSFGGGGAGGSW